MPTRNDEGQASFWKIPFLNGIELLHVSNVFYDYPLHIHEEYCVVLVLRGKEVITCLGRNHVAGPNSILLINAEEAHSSHSFGTEYVVFKIQADVLDRVYLDLFGAKPTKPLFVEMVRRDKGLFTTFINLYRKLKKNISLLEKESELILALEKLLLRLNENRSLLQPDRRKLRSVEMARNYLRDHYSESISLSHLATIVELSRFHLLRIFRNQVGLSPHEYQTQVRIMQARKLLREGYSVVETALQTGFFDQSHLTRNFKKIVGVSPGQYLSHSNIVQETARSIE